MAPFPDSTPTGSSAPEVVATAPAEESALPGMKRGIAIGVACSVGIIMVALLAFFAYRRRKQQTGRHMKLKPEEPVEMDTGGFWPQEKKRHIQTVPIETDAQTIHELGGSEVPELPSQYEAQEMNANRKTPRASCGGGEDDAYSQKLKQWNEWSIALRTDQPQSVLESNNHYSERSPSQSQPTNMSQVGDHMLYIPWQDTSFNNESPLALSPLEDAHLTPKRDERALQQRYYDQART